MTFPRRFPVAALVLIALLPLACAKSKSKKNDSNDSPADAPSAQEPAAAPGSPQALVGRIKLADLAQSSQLQADFAATAETAAKLASADLAAAAFAAGTPLKFSDSSDTTLENTAGLGGGNGYSGGYYGSYDDGYGGGYGGCNCGWNFPILRGIAGAISSVGSLIFGYGRSYGYDSYGYGYGSYGYGGSCGNNGYGNSGYGYGSYDVNNPPFPFGPGTDYQNPNYVWTPNGPMYNNPTYNPLPTSGVQVGTTYTTGIAGCTPSVYDQSRGWIAAAAPASANAPLCNGQSAPSGVGPATGTTYTTGAANCVASTYDANGGWQASTQTSDTSAPLCDGNVYSNVTGTGAQVNDQMPGFAPVYTVDGINTNFKYAGSYDDATHRYYVYGIQ